MTEKQKSDAVDQQGALTQPSINAQTARELDDIERHKAHQFESINDEQRLGFMIRVPNMPNIMKMEANDKDLWAEGQMTARGFTPLRFTHVVMAITDKNGADLLLETYIYKKEAVEKYNVHKSLVGAK